MHRLKGVGSSQNGPTADLIRKRARALRAMRSRRAFTAPKLVRLRTSFAGKADASATAGNGDADRAASIILLVEEAAGVAVGAGHRQLRRLIDLGRRRGANIS